MPHPVPPSSMNARGAAATVGAGALVALCAVALCSSDAIAARKKKKARGKAAVEQPAPVAEVAPPPPPEKPAVDSELVAIGAPAAGAGRLVVLHLAAAGSAQALDIYTLVPKPGFNVDRVGERVPYGGAAAIDRPPGGVSAISLPTGTAMPRTPGMFSGPYLKAGEVVHVAAVGAPRDNGFLHGHLANVTGEFPEGAARIGWSEVRGREGKFEVCADSGSGLTKWFHYEVGPSTWPVSSSFTGKGWDNFRNVMAGKVTVELRERVAAECAGKLLGSTTLPLPSGPVKLIHYGAETGAGHLLVCPQGPPFDCLHRALTPPA